MSICFLLTCADVFWLSLVVGVRNSALSVLLLLLTVQNRILLVVVGLKVLRRKGVQRDHLQVSHARYYIFSRVLSGLPCSLKGACFFVCSFIKKVPNAKGRWWRWEKPPPGERRLCITYLAIWLVGSVSHCRGTFVVGPRLTRWRDGGSGCVSW